MNYGYGQQYPMSQGYGQGNSYAGGYSNGYSQGGYSQGQSFLQPNVSSTYGYSDAGVEAYPVAPANTVIFFHVNFNNEPVMWIKSVDPSGRPLPILSFELTPRNMGYSQAVQISQQPNMSEYVKRNEVEDMVNGIMSRNMNGTSMNGQMSMNNGGSQGQSSFQQMPMNNQNQEVQR